MYLTGLIKIIIQTVIVCIILYAASIYLEKKFNHPNHTSIINYYNISRTSLLSDVVASKFSKAPSSLELFQWTKILPTEFKKLLSEEYYQTRAIAYDQIEFKMDSKLHSYFQIFLVDFFRMNSHLLNDSSNRTNQNDSRKYTTPNTTDLTTVLQSYLDHVITDERIHRLSPDFYLSLRFLKFTNNNDSLDSLAVSSRQLSWKSCPLCGELKDIILNATNGIPSSP